MDNISITLPIQAWNNILAVLGDRPFKEVADLIMEIKRQAEGQVSTASTVETSEAEATVQ
jgi:hypothetical protein